jgi:iron-sulfur cluster repair protein YtfE (RIC family)
MQNYSRTGPGGMAHNHPDLRIHRLEAVIAGSATRRTTMTVTTGSDPVEAIKASPIPFCLYRDVHKGLRYALFQLVTAVGSADCADAPARGAVVDQLHAVIRLLTEHHDHEDTHLQPVIRANAPTLATALEDGHAEVEHDLVEIELRTDRLAMSTGTEAVMTGLDLYGFLGLFVGRYLAHMGLEEGAVMAALRETTSIEDLLQVQVAVRSSVPPSTMCRFIEVIMPALNPQERTAVLGGMHAGAPPEIFELFRATTEAALEPAAYEALAGRIGLV